MMAFISMGANVAIAIYIFYSGTSNIEASIALLICFILFSIQYSYLFFTNKLHATSFSLLLYWGYGFILPGLYQVRTDTYPWASAAINPDTVSGAAMLALFSCLAFFLGFFLFDNAAPQ